MVSKRQQIIETYLGKNVRVIVDRPVGYVHGDLVYPVNYGYLPGVIAGDGEAQDAYILGVREPLSFFDGRVIGAVCRRDDCEDKLIVAPEGVLLHQGQIEEAVFFQEQYFDTYVVSLFRKSCGVLPYRVVAGKRQFLLVFEAFSQCWSLPKGHMEAGETEMQTALRELFEETGLTAVLSYGKAASISYPISSVSSKQVVFFLGEVSGQLKIREGEISAFRWVDESQLQDYLFADTVEACKKLLDSE